MDKPTPRTDALKRKQEGYPILPTDDSVLLQWVSEWMELASELERNGSILRETTKNQNAYIEELEQTVARLRAALETIQQWDCLNPPRADLLGDLPWLRGVVDAALKKEP